MSATVDSFMTARSGGLTTILRFHLPKTQEVPSVILNVYVLHDPIHPFTTVPNDDGQPRAQAHPEPLRG